MIPIFNNSDIEDMFLRLKFDTVKISKLERDMYEIWACPFVKITPLFMIQHA